MLLLFKLENFFELLLCQGYPLMQLQETFQQSKIYLLTSVHYVSRRVAAILPHQVGVSSSSSICRTQYGVMCLD